MLQIGTLSIENGLIMAPMAGYTHLAFRLLIKRLGAGLVMTEMVSAMGLTMGQEKTLEYLRTHPDEKPLGVQIFGADPEAMARASMIAAEAGADLIDINMGCPVKKVVKTGAGAALLQDLGKIAAIVSAVRRACPLPLTVKIRTGWSSKEPRDGSRTARLPGFFRPCGLDLDRQSKRAGQDSGHRERRRGGPSGSDCDEGANSVQWGHDREGGHPESLAFRTDHEP